jgi:hypothetical protein
MNRLALGPRSRHPSACPSCFLLPLQVPPGAMSTKTAMNYEWQTGWEKLLNTAAVAAPLLALILAKKQVNAF